MTTAHIEFDVRDVCDDPTCHACLTKIMAWAMNERLVQLGQKKSRIKDVFPIFLTATAIMANAARPPIDAREAGKALRKRVGETAEKMEGKDRIIEIIGGGSSLSAMFAAVLADILKDVEVKPEPAAEPVEPAPEPFEATVGIDMASGGDVTAEFPDMPEPAPPE